MAKKTPSEASGIARGPGERSTGGKSTFIGQDAGTVDVGYSATNVQLVDIGNSNAYESRKTPIDRLHVPYGGAGDNLDRVVPGNVSPRPGAGPDRSYRNPKGR